MPIHKSFDIYKYNLAIVFIWRVTVSAVHGGDMNAPLEESRLFCALVCCSCFSFHKNTIVSTWRYWF